MSIKFRDEPKGELALKHGGTQIIRPKRTTGVVFKDQPKMAFSAEPVRKLAGRGSWFELRVDEFLGGEMCLMALGFTATDPETLGPPEEGEEAPPLPGVAGLLPRTFVCGYSRSVYWNGDRVQIESPFKKLKPAKIFTIGALANNLTGGLDIFINRRLVTSFDPVAKAMASLPHDEPLWAVVDCCGGLKKATLLTDSVPPSEEEAALPEPDDDARPTDKPDGEQADAAEAAAEAAAEVTGKQRQRPESGPRLAFRAAFRTTGLTGLQGSRTTGLQVLASDAEEKEVSTGVDLQDACLERLRLTGLLQRQRDRPPTTEDLADRQREALEELAGEAVRLREENSWLATQSSCEAHNTSVSSQPHRARSAFEELRDEVGKLRRRFADFRCRERRCRVEEWRLASCKGDSRDVIHQMKLQEQQLQELKRKLGDGEGSLRQATEQVARGRLEAEEEQAAIRDLNREVIATREACYLPARLKRETSFLMKIFDQEGGRLKTKRHLRSLESCKKLYEEVVAQAPSVLPLASRTKSDMEVLFSRYLQLEEGHNRALQRLHMAVTRGLVKDTALLDLARRPGFAAK
ncbi:unnamed protein product [Polarella glacialis]|uniref:Uncharacterized protein n=1 Tax=Polarella glacialis TaxID=89957 RepID=A0A813KVK3_POLGL|nr:unnamed protein product [Polarella glacialis]